ncbi:MAG: serine/threonine-protein kinase, partial [Pirellulaceae bacterium]
MNQPSDDQTRNQEPPQPSSLRDVTKSIPLNATVDHTPSASNEADGKKQHETLDATVDFESTITPQRSASLRPNPKSGLTNRQFGDYELLDEIARGGMGVVYKARQRKLNRIVAVKMILAGQFASPEHVQRFYSEAEAAANLDHPGIVPIYEVNEQDGQHFFSMGYVDGASLSELVKDRPLAPREAAKITRQVADAIQYAHDHRVIHRDLKPGNILMTADGQPRVTDFGLAKTVEGDSDLTATGQVLGTPSYMPPEQAAGRIEAIGPRSDIYSLGAVLYCLLTGRPPFQSASAVETIRQ